MPIKNYERSGLEGETTYWRRNECTSVCWGQLLWLLILRWYMTKTHAQRRNWKQMWWNRMRSSFKNRNVTNYDFWTTHANFNSPNKINIPPIKHVHPLCFRTRTLLWAGLRNQEPSRSQRHWSSQTQGWGLGVIGEMTLAGDHARKRIRFLFQHSERLKSHFVYVSLWRD